MRHLLTITTCLLAIVLLPTSVRGQDEDKKPAGAAQLDYAEQIVPLLRTYCVGCHNTDDREGGLDLSSFAELMKGGKRGAVLSPGRADLSRLVRVMNGATKLVMPPEGSQQPTEAEVALIAAWIKAGARGPDGAEPPIQLVTPRIAPTAAVRQPITGLAIRPFDEGKQEAPLIAVARYGGVTLEQLGDGRLLSQFTPEAGTVNAVIFSSRGDLLITGGGETGVYGEAIVWDVASGQPRQTLRGHRDAVFGIAISSDGRLLATTGYDRLLVIWDLETGQPKHTIKGHNGPVHAVAIHPDGKIVATASDDRTVKLWDIQSGQRLETLSQSLKELYCLSFSPDGSRLAAGGVDHRIRIWQISKDAREGTNPLIYSVYAHQAAILQLCYSPDGQRLVSSAEDSLIKVWHADTMVLQEKLPARTNWVTALAMNDTAVVHSGTLDGRRESLPIGLAVEQANSAATFFESLGDVSYGPQPAIDKLPRLAEQEPNDEAGQATSIEVPLVVEGTIARPAEDGAASSDQDLFRFSASAADQWVIETRAARDKSPLDSKIEVLHADGQPVGRLLLRAVRDSEVEFRPLPSDNSGARLKNYEEMLLNQFVYINGEVTKLFRQRRGPDSDSVFYPGVGKRHTFFDTTARSHPLGQPCYIVLPYPVGTVLPDNGLPVFPVYYENDDDSRRQFGSDSQLVFTAPADADYLVRVKDVRGFDGDDYKYQLIIRRPEPGFSIAVSGANPVISPGSGKLFTVTATRKDHFNGPIRVDIEGLPAGFQVTTPLLIESGHDSVSGLIHAHPQASQTDASNWSGSRLTATATVAGQELQQSAGTLGTIKLAARTTLLAHLTPQDDSPLPVTAFPAAATRPWTVLAPQTSTTAHANTSLRTLPDQSLLAEGEATDTETFVVTLRTSARRIASLKLAALGHSSLPAGAPGRGPDNGNFIISELSLTARALDGTSEPVELAISGVRADYSQGSWNVAGIHDGDEKTGWAVARGDKDNKFTVVTNEGDPSHWVELDLAEPLAIAGGAELTVTIKCTSDVKQHVLGHFQLSYTTESLPTPDLSVDPIAEVTIVPGQFTECRLSVERLGFDGRISFDVNNLPHGVIVQDIGLSGVLIPEGKMQRTIYLSAESWVPETRRLFYAVAKVEGDQVTLPMILRIVNPSYNAAASK